MDKIKRFIAREREETAVLLRCIPATVVTLFVVSVISMNLLANKTLVQTPYIAIDGGILISWLSFICMDIITKHFGPRASNRISILAALINLLTCAIFYIASIIPSTANDYTAFDSVLGGTWFILMGSTVAFLVSAVVNNLLNFAIGRLFKRGADSKLAFCVQSYISTFVGQFIDNFLFSIMVFHIFAPIFWDGFSWTVLQCTLCALTGAALELILEVLFSPLGFRMLKRWRENGVGKAYLDLMNKEADV